MSECFVEPEFDKEEREGTGRDRQTDRVRGKRRMKKREIVTEKEIGK